MNDLRPAILKVNMLQDAGGAAKKYICTFIYWSTQATAAPFRNDGLFQLTILLEEICQVELIEPGYWVGTNC